MRARNALVALPLLAFALVACGQSVPESPAPAANATVRVANSEIGRILVDQSGRTLYGFTKDKDKASACDESCIAVWPALTGPKEAGDGANPSLLGQAPQTEGVAQLTYGEWPLYYYVGDTVAGDVNGHGVDGEWFPVSPEGKLVTG